MKKITKKKSYKEIIKKFEDSNQVKDFQLFCAKNYDVIPTIDTTKRWAIGKGRPTKVYQYVILKWDEYNAE